MLLPVASAELVPEQAPVAATLEPASPVQDWNEPSFHLRTPAAERKRQLGTSYLRPDHRQLATGLASQFSGTQMKKGVVQPLLTTELEPGEVIRSTLQMPHPLAICSVLDP